MHKLILAVAAFACAVSSLAQNCSPTVNPLTGRWSCATGTGSGGGSVTSVGAVGTANQITVTGASPITTSGSWTFSIPTNPIFPGNVSATGSIASNSTALDTICSGATGGCLQMGAAGNANMWLGANPTSSLALQFPNANPAANNLMMFGAPSSGTATFQWGGLGTGLGFSGGNINVTAAPLSALATQSADTVVANASGSTAVPTAVALPTTGTNGCSGSTNGLTYNNSTHAFGCNTSLGPGTVTSFSAGNASPLFTTSVATATSTPALTFTISNFAAHTFYGNNTGSSAAPAANAIGAQDVSPNTYVSGGGTAQAQTITLAPAVTSLVAGLEVSWLPSNANSGASPTLAVNGLTATTITKCGATALVASDLTTTAIAIARYDGTEFQLLNPQSAPCGNSGGATTNQNIRTIAAHFTASDFSAAITKCVLVRSAGTIQEQTIDVDVAGGASSNNQIDVRTVARASWTGPGSASSITASAIPKAGTSLVVTDSTLTGWTTSVTANTFFCFVPSLLSNATFVDISLKVAAN